MGCTFVCTIRTKCTSFNACHYARFYHPELGIFFFKDPYITCLLPSYVVFLNNIIQLNIAVMQPISLGLLAAGALILLVSCLRSYRTLFPSYLSNAHQQFLAKLIINFFFHPLSSFPGPRLWAVSRFPYVATLWKGQLHSRVKEIHDRYGPIVRLAPNELSFIDASAWKDIYSGQVGNKGFPKNNVISGAQGFYSLIDANDDDHSRFRGTLQSSFSAQALQAREAMFQTYVGLLIKNLKDQVDPMSLEFEKDSEELGVVNIVKHLNWTTFDITGEITFSESFGCLEGRITNPWIALIFSHLKASALLIGLRFYYPLDEYLLWLIPKSLQKEKERYISLSKGKVHRRIDHPPKGKVADFMTPALQRMGHEDGMSIREIEGTFTTLIIGGSETTATSIAGMINYLSKHPESLAKLAAEIRSFESESDLTLVRLGHLPYLNGVIQEGLRLCTPLPSGLPRVVAPGGAIICGKFVAGGVSPSSPGS